MRTSYGTTSSSSHTTANQHTQHQPKKSSTASANNVSQVEPKVYLAGERTLLAWLRLAILISTFALAMYNGVPETNTTGQIFAFSYIIIAALTAIYAYYLYYSRLRKIQNKAIGHFDELTGPGVICFLLFVVVLLNFIFRVKYRESPVRPPKSPWLAKFLAENLPEGVMMLSPSS